MSTPVILPASSSIEMCEQEDPRAHTPNAKALIEDGDTVYAARFSDQGFTSEQLSARISRNHYDSPVDIADEEVVWSMLEVGLQSYIFGHLMRELKNPLRIAEVLGLHRHEILNLLHILNTQSRYPLNTHQLYSYCASLSRDVSGSVDPHVLKQYSAYFEFSSNFDAATQRQRILAYAYLQQHDVRGDFVDALTRYQEGSWVDQNPESVSVDVSHRNKILRRLLKSPYFPPSIREDLLAKCSNDLSILEAWAVDPSRLSENDFTHVQPASGSRMSLPRYVMRYLRSLRRHFLKSEFRHSYGSRDAIDVHLLQLVVAYTAQIHTLRSRVKRLPLTDEQERKEVFRTARKRLESKLVTSFRRSIVRQLKADFRNHLPIISDKLITLANAHYTSEPDSASEVEEEISQQSTTPSITASEDQDTQPNTSAQPRARSLSTASFHTARNLPEELENIRLSPVKSPERPDYSPISSHDEPSDSETTRLPVTEAVNHNSYPMELFQSRATPWKSARQTVTTNKDSTTGTHLPPPTTTISTAQIVPFHTTNAYPPLLAGIHEAALAKSPSCASATSSANKSNQPPIIPPHPPRLKFKPLVQTEVATPETLKSQPESSTPAVEPDNPGSKPPKATRSDKGKKRGKYNMKKMRSSAEASADSDTSKSVKEQVKGRVLTK